MDEGPPGTRQSKRPVEGNAKSKRANKKEKERKKRNASNDDASLRFFPPLRLLDTPTCPRGATDAVFFHPSLATPTVVFVLPFAASPSHCFHSSWKSALCRPSNFTCNKAKRGADFDAV